MKDLDPAVESLIFERIRELKHTIDIDESDLTPIQEFYKDANIFITGCTGFLGQILIEKLLRSCPVSTLYLLVRGKKGKSADMRMDEIFDTYMFSRMRKVCPDFRKKVVMIEGDCQFSELGLSDQDKELLINEVNIIFHVAATVRFDEKLNVASDINVRATRDICIFAQKMLKLKAFVHVSTAYGNCPQDIIEERIYPPAMKHHQLMKLCKNIDQVLLDKLTPHFIKMYPNTYTFTKQIAEYVIKEEAKDLPVAVYRPSVVVSTYREPIRGWINNLYGPTGPLFGTAMGIIRILLGDTENNANIIPVDICVNGLIATAWDAAERFEKVKEEDKAYELPVYNSESSTDKPITWNQYQQLAAKYGLYTPLSRAIWFYSIYFVTSYPLYLILSFLSHTIPGLILDTILFCRGKKLRLGKIYPKINKFSTLVSFFSIKRIYFKSENIEKMLNRMSEKDKKVFFCNLKELDWEEFFTTYLPGIRVHFMKDPLENVPEATKRYRRLEIAHTIVKFILWLIAAAIIWFLVSNVNRLSAIFKYI